MEYKITTEYGTFWYKGPGMEILHREDGPAVEYADGEKWWYLNGRLQREDGPAVESNDGYKEWWLNDKRYLFKDYCKKLIELGYTEEDITILKLKYS